MGELLDMDPTDFKDEKKKHEILKKIKKIKELHRVILDNEIHKQNQQSQKQIFNYQLYVIEKHFELKAGTFATYEVNIDSLGIIKELLNMKQTDFNDADKNDKILDKIEKIKELNTVILENWDEEAPYQQLLKKMFNEQLNDIETHFGLEAGTFGKPYGENTNPHPKSGGKSRRRRAKSSKRTKRSKARKSGKKSSKRSTRKTRRSRRKH